MAADICVIFNPSAGRGRGAARLASLQQHLAGRADFWPTAQRGHAEELAREAAAAGYRVVAAAGGDGTVHEVANGLLMAGQPDVAFAVIPIGSANDYAHSLETDHNQANIKPQAAWSRRVDVGIVRDGSGRQRYLVCCLGLGFNGMVTLEARKIHRLQGLALYGLATLRALWYHYGCPAIEIGIDDSPRVTWPTLMLSILLGRREGGFVLAPNAQLDDGLFDYVHADGLSRFEVLRLLPRLAISGPPTDNPKVRLGRCRRIALHSPVPLAVHIDGEFFAQPKDNIRDLEIVIQPAALTVQTGLFG